MGAVREGVSGGVGGMRGWAGVCVGLVWGGCSAVLLPVPPVLPVPLPPAPLPPQLHLHTLTAWPTLTTRTLPAVPNFKFAFRLFLSFIILLSEAGAGRLAGGGGRRALERRRRHSRSRWVDNMQACRLSPQRGQV